jgi:hypothetical protein
VTGSAAGSDVDERADFCCPAGVGKLRARFCNLRPVRITVRVEGPISEGETLGWFSDHFQTQYEGNAIEVETRVIGFMGRARYSLIINNQRVDDIEGTLGTFSLRGFLP